jgi:AcrR family transcriptional regulator
MTSQPFHHGNLRAVLLERAERMLRQEGVEGISLRELARQAGVSHGAPRSHFVDRQALLDALAERGFDRLTAQVEHEASSPGSFAEKLVRVGHAYVEFGVDDAALMELMFAGKVNGGPGPLQYAAARLFGAFDQMLGSDPSADRQPGDPRYRFNLLFAATMQGTATLLAAGRVSRSDGETLVDDAIEILLNSALGLQVVPT